MLFCLGVYCYSNNCPVVRVEVLGYIVSIDVREKLTTYGGECILTTIKPEQDTNPIIVIMDYAGMLCPLQARGI